ncbi:hypothetical protein FB390_1423 [Nocardia bhagyanarayanae]|uniref:Uncharacterized protein n=1 Tax=Nocardia bhagyanarayanae TaxID=1215925 RepID=A0A543F7L2_9NOCA|nr:hypothetical protein FB390_1423 [Nocardia bhagyanarayanae]
MMSERSERPISSVVTEIPVQPSLPQATRMPEPSVSEAMA